MGYILKEAYEERDLVKALAKLNGLISTEDSKLSDKLHDLQLSHNRKKKALKKLLEWLEDDDKWQDPVNIGMHRMKAYELVENVLFTDGRANIK